MKNVKINWKVRFNKENIVFIAEIVASVFVPILAYFGMNWEDMTTWAAIGSLLWQAIQNPVVVLAVGVSLFNAITDPTTKGIGDSERALTYAKPGVPKATEPPAE